MAFLALEPREFRFNGLAHSSNGLGAKLCLEQFNGIESAFRSAGEAFLCLAHTN
jgi:hypothetical protein